MLRKYRKRLFHIGAIVTTLWSKVIYAAYTGTFSSNVPSVGGASENIAGTIGMFTEVFYNICFVIGGAMLLGSIIQYKNYRENPSQVRLSTPIFLLIIGGILIALPFIAKLSAAATAGGG